MVDTHQQPASSQLNPHVVCALYAVTAMPARARSIVLCLTGPSCPHLPLFPPPNPQVVGSIVLVGVAVPIVLPLLLPLGAAFAWVRQGYQTGSRDMRRWARWTCFRRAWLRARHPWPWELWPIKGSLGQAAGPSSHCSLASTPSHSAPIPRAPPTHLPQA